MLCNAMQCRADERIAGGRAEWRTELQHTEGLEIFEGSAKCVKHCTLLSSPLQSLPFFCDIEPNNFIYYNPHTVEHSQQPSSAVMLTPVRLLVLACVGLALLSGESSAASSASSSSSSNDVSMFIGIVSVSAMPHSIASLSDASIHAVSCHTMPCDAMQRAAMRSMTMNGNGKVNLIKLRIVVELT